MRVAISALPEAVQAQVTGNRARVSYGDPARPTVITVACDDGELILFAERAYEHADLARALG